MLVFRAGWDALVRARIAVFAGILTCQWRAGSAVDALFARVAVIGATALLANTLTAEKPLSAVWQAGTAISRGDADAVAALLGLRIATSVVAGSASELGICAARACVLVALARWATSGTAAAVVRQIATGVVAGAASELCFRTADAFLLVAQIERTAGGVAAAVVRVRATPIATGELPFRTLRSNLVQMGGGRTPEDGATEEHFQCLATRKPGS